MPFEIHPLDRDLMHPAFLLATETFVEGSTLHRALGVRLSEYRDYLRPSFEEIVEEGLSVGAINRESDILVGCLIVTDFHHQLSATIGRIPKFAPLSALTAELTRQYVLKRSIGAGE